MTDTLHELQPRPDDLVVVPESMEVPAEVPFHVYKMKFLHAPSIIRSGGYSMGFLDKFTSSALGQLLGVRPVLTNDERLTEDVVIIHHDEDEPSAADQEALTPGEILVQLNEFMESKQSSSLGSNPDLTARPADVTSTDLARFWRYVRPKQLIQKMDGNFTQGVSPRGGVAFYIELDPENKTFAFSYALCHTMENFCYEVARQVSKGRFESEDWYEVSNYDENISVVENIGVAITNLLIYSGDLNKPEGQPSFSSLSPKFNLVDLKEILKRI